MIGLGMGRGECAAAEIDPAESFNLTLFYTQKENAFADLQIDIYRVAELDPDGEYRLIEPFAEYPINMRGIDSISGRQKIAQTIRHYVAANQIAAYQSLNTDDRGTVSFAGLEKGLYLVAGITARNNNGAFAFGDFLIDLPVSD